MVDGERSIRVVEEKSYREVEGKCCCEEISGEIR